MERAVLELLGRHSDMALAVCDADGIVTLRTPALERMLGGPGMPSLQDSTVLNLLDSTAERTLSRDEVPMARALRGETVIDAVIAVRRTDELLVFLRCNAGPLRHPDGEIRGAMTLVQDITREWVADLKQKELHDRLVTTVNHELRTPLSKIIGHAELLLDEVEAGGLPASVERSVRAVARASSDLARMAERLTLLARLGEHTRVRPACTDAADLVRTVVGSEADAAEAAGIGLRAVAPDRMPATIDVRSVTRAIRELVGNALCHASDGSTVAVELCSLDGHLEIRVLDDGPGIPASQRTRVVQPFERGHEQGESSSSPGLGLAIASAVAAAHGGRLELEDNEPRGLRARMLLRKEPA